MCGVYLKSFSIILVIFGDRDICFRKTSDLLEGSGQPEVLAYTQTWILWYAFPAAGHQEYKDFMNWREHFNHLWKWMHIYLWNPFTYLAYTKCCGNAHVHAPWEKDFYLYKPAHWKSRLLILVLKQTLPNKTPEPLLKPFPATALEALFSHLWCTPQY